MESSSSVPASNRQKKVLMLFDVPPQGLSMQEAGAVIDDLFADSAKRDRWNRYKLATKDFGRETGELRPFTEEQLASVRVPDNWDGEEEIRVADIELAQKLISSHGLVDSPQAAIVFANKLFMFTGKFAFGSRKECVAAVETRGGRCTDKVVTLALDYLVVGSLGSPAWAHGDFGSKILDAVLVRHQFGTLAIVSEAAWLSCAGH